VDDPVAQRMPNENSFLSFVTGLMGIPGTQCRYANPRGLDQTMEIALSLQEAERQEKISESSYAKFDRSVRPMSKSPNRKYPDYEKQRPPTDTGADSSSRSHLYKTSNSASKSATPSIRNSRTKAALRFSECEGLGHFARECLTRLRRETNPSDSRGKRAQLGVRGVQVPPATSPLS